MSTGLNLLLRWCTRLNMWMGRCTRLGMLVRCYCLSWWSRSWQATAPCCLHLLSLPSGIGDCSAMKGSLAICHNIHNSASNISSGSIKLTELYVCFKHCCDKCDAATSCFPGTDRGLGVERLELRLGQQGCLLDSVQIVEIMWMGAVLKPASQRFRTLCVSSSSADWRAGRTESKGLTENRWEEVAVIIGFNFKYWTG